MSSWLSFTYLQSRTHQLVIVVCVLLALLGQMPTSAAGWVLGHPDPLGGQLVNKPTKGHRRRKRRLQARLQASREYQWSVIQQYVKSSWPVPCIRVTFLLALFFFWLPLALPLSFVPLFLWGVHLLAYRYPTVPEWQLTKRYSQSVEAILMKGAASIYLAELLEYIFILDRTNSYLNASFLIGTSSKNFASPQVKLESLKNEEQQVTHYEATLSGTFKLRITAGDSFRLRLFILILRQLEVYETSQIGRPTREGNHPFIKQQELAQAYQISQPQISHWESYWQAADWRRLLSVRSPEILTLETKERVINTFATFPWWGNRKVHQYLQKQGLKVSHSQVKQAARESGWLKLRQKLRERFVISADSFRPRDEFLVSQLLSKIEELTTALEDANALPSQFWFEVEPLEQLCQELQIEKCCQVKALPWALRLEQLLFGNWEMLNDGTTRCIYCASEQVARKSRKPRFKKVMGEDGQIREIEVYRYYCRNQACDKGSFTDMPADCLPYSPYSVTRHLLAFQMYSWAGSSYRRCGAALGLAPVTVYRWVGALGQQLLPIAALFGVVRSSGIIGIDEKFVLVPKNNKPKSKMSRWMYVYVAVDCYSYDLLHVALYRYRNEASTRDFLLALRAKGYQPKVVVTDLWETYNSLIKELFPNATHQECIFHAHQAIQKKFKEVYGPNYRTDSAQAVELKSQITRIFQARTKRTAQKRYLLVMALSEQVVKSNPKSKPIFRFLETHMPLLLPAIESKSIPRTNNVAELVIRRFSQHYQNFTGFENFESAQTFLAVFEKVYRFTPFSPEAQPHLRGRCPLEIAGYDISQMPMAMICAGLSPQWSSVEKEENPLQEPKEPSSLLTPNTDSSFNELLSCP